MICMKRLVRISLRTLLIVFAVACVITGAIVIPLVRKVQDAKSSLEAVNAIKSFGGNIEYSDNSDRAHYEQIASDLFGREFVDDIVSVNLGGTLLRGGNLEHVFTQITDDDLIKVRDLEDVRSLYLCRTLITDDGLVQLKSLQKLEVLELNNTKITDKGLKHLSALTTLKHLSLADVVAYGTFFGSGSREETDHVVYVVPQITDAGLMYLESLKNLESLDLAGTQVTEAGVMRLQQALPNCNISWKIKRPTSDVERIPLRNPNYQGNMGAIVFPEEDMSVFQGN